MPAEVLTAATPAWRELLATPPDVQFPQGRLCPLDRSCLRLQADKLPTPPSWGCSACGARWDQHGRNGRWLTGDGRVVERRWLDHWTAAAIAAGAGIGLSAAAGWRLRAYEPVVPDRLLLVVAVALLAAGAAVYGVLVLLRWLGERRYAGNRVLGPADQPVAGVPDGR